MKKTDVLVLKSTVPVAEALNAALVKLRKKLKVGNGGISEEDWYIACADAMVGALKHVKANLPDESASKYA